MKKILLIEDNLEMRENTAEILELASYDVRTAENGKLGVKEAMAWNPDLIICDIMMPVMDGYEALYLLSKNPKTSTIPFIFMTAKAEKTDMRKGMNMGADDYLTKPFEEMELLDAIEARLKKNDSIKDEFERNLDGLNDFINQARGVHQLTELAEDRKIKKYKKKETIFREGDYANFLFFVVRGKIKATKTDDFGKDLVTDIISEGEFLGYLTLFEGPEYAESAIAIEETELAVIPKNEFLSLMNDNRDVSAKFIKMLANNVKEKEERLLRLAYSPVRERVAHALLTLHKRFKSGSASEGIKFSREDLASIVGTATESLIRQLSDFKEEGLISVEGREINIADEEALKKVVGMH